MKKNPLTNKDGEVRELTSSDIRNMKSATQVLPRELSDILGKRRVDQRGPQKIPTKNPHHASL